MPGQALLAAGSRRFSRSLDACEPALGPEKAPEHCGSLESNERNFLSLRCVYVSMLCLRGREVERRLCRNRRVLQEAHVAPMIRSLKPFMKERICFDHFRE